MAAASSLPASARTTASPFAEVFAQLQPHMAGLDRFLHAQLDAFEPEIREMANYCIDTSGKRIRPSLVFLSGWRDATVQPDLVRAAAVVELVHLATLVHDDIMDEAEVRRSRRTAARAFGTTPAVLLGDALFAHALHLASQFPTTEVCLAVSESIRRVCAGEIVQTLRRGTTELSRADYDRIIDLKTAELFRLSCRLGARLSGAEAGLVTAAAEFGRRLGVAYQIFDDLADYFGQEQRIGKTLGTDLASGKITLPLFVLRDRLPPAESAALAAEIRGEQPPQLALRLQQMRELGVFATVSETIEAEIVQGTAALQPWAQHPVTPLLGQLSDVLRRQVQGLQAPA
ncbi:MAG: polyprenyl synthetase family protein [Opitutae bacterium]|nr:polyprenyl synthetase family protein [Opitutae bacterium]